MILFFILHWAYSAQLAATLRVPSSWLKWMPVLYTVSPHYNRSVYNRNLDTAYQSAVSCCPSYPFHWLSFLQIGFWYNDIIIRTAGRSVLLHSGLLYCGHPVFNSFWTQKSSGILLGGISTERYFGSRWSEQPFNDGDMHRGPNCSPYSTVKTGKLLSENLERNKPVRQSCLCLWLRNHSVYNTII